MTEAKGGRLCKTTAIGEKPKQSKQADFNDSDEENNEEEGGEIAEGKQQRQRRPFTCPAEVGKSPRRSYRSNRMTGAFEKDKKRSSA